MTTPPPQRYLSTACEADLERYGDSFRGAGYTRSEQEAAAMYDVMLDVVREKDEPVTLLDLGCGLAHLLDRIHASPLRRNVRYSGLDISRKYLDAAAVRHPGVAFLHMDILESDEALPDYDYIVLNGLFNFRGELPYERMLLYWQQMIAVAYKHCRKGIAFNVMSKIVDWERDDLFHLPFETLTRFVAAELSRTFVIRHDYPTWEYTTYVYRSPAPR